MTVCWQTKSVHHSRQAVIVCRDYGLKSLTTTLWNGRLKPREHTSLWQWFQRSFIKKTKTFHLFTLCKFCSKTAILGNLNKEDLRYPQYEIIG